MAIFTRYRDAVGIIDADPLGINAAADAYAAVSTEAREAAARHTELVDLLQPKKINDRRARLADAGDFDGVMAFDEQVREFTVEAQVRQRHQPILQNKVRAASQHLAALQVRKVEVEQAVGVAAIDQHVPDLLALIDRVLDTAAPYAEASADVRGGSQNRLVVKLEELRHFLTTADRAGWPALVAAAGSVLDTEPQHAAIAAFDGTRQGRPAAHVGIFDR